MSQIKKPLELLSPARNLEHGIEAVKHGADAVYIGGPAFGARAAAGNSIADIEKLTEFAHRYAARVFVTLNTILRDDELESACTLAWQAFEAGADALILQDLGLLECDLPPIALHASTQTDNRTVEKFRFLEQVGFSQIVLARELSLDQIRAITSEAKATAEFFIHGALCVSYSGQCNISHALTGRSANRGECSQLCRLPYSLADQDGTILAKDAHLLSLKDNDQSANLRDLIDAGVRSFKIEGRLKDMSYVKNITAYYRQLLDEILEQREDCGRASSGRCIFLFQPQPAKTFNRGGTDYFVRARQGDIADFRTPKFAGEPIGRIRRVGRDHFEIDSEQHIHNGDGLSFFDEKGELSGLRVNRAGGKRIFPAEFPNGLVAGTEIFRNRDHEFERVLEKASAERRIAVRLRLEETDDGFVLRVTDEDGNSAAASVAAAKHRATNPELVVSSLRQHLGKLGSTVFRAEEIAIAFGEPWFLPPFLANQLRRDAVAALEAARANAYRRPPRFPAVEPPPNYPADELTYLGNVFNRKARRFYERHGVALIAPAFECNRETSEVSLMITKHCLRFSFHLCPKQEKGIRPDPLVLLRGNDRLTLRFDCKRCEMHVVGKLQIKGNQARSAAASPSSQAENARTAGRSATASGTTR